MFASSTHVLSRYPMYCYTMVTRLEMYTPIVISETQTMYTPRISISHTPKVISTTITPVQILLLSDYDLCFQDWMHQKPST